MREFESQCIQLVENFLLSLAPPKKVETEEKASNTSIKTEFISIAEKGIAKFEKKHSENENE